MLFGIRADEQARLVAAGEEVRIYVPFRRALVLVPDAPDGRAAGESGPGAARAGGWWVAVPARGVGRGPCRRAAFRLLDLHPFRDLQCLGTAAPDPIGHVRVLNGPGL